MSDSGGAIMHLLHMSEHAQLGIVTEKKFPLRVSRSVTTQLLPIVWTDSHELMLSAYDHTWSQQIASGIKQLHDAHFSETGLFVSATCGAEHGLFCSPLRFTHWCSSAQ
eukprot:gnl/TRDRNA2_/TRDRNA2_158873_c2_seq2.p1 gnl/TRDRNA2_/TRDRNA2_158873_c2~~gnl/TRDRNA2_/TRDRNA2_158873_c2_seq2.p1  ORF type:complete len:123 (-),score=9.75 gnl/TRDRNA2_/TRDRNA2_158873_c2_seq2:21-347(-)